MKIMVLGSGGQLGQSLIKNLNNYKWELVEATRQSVDITDHCLIENFILEHKPNIIINATAYTAVDEAEFNIKTAYDVNHKAIKNLANCAHNVNSVLLHFSTDYVFNGNSSVPYKETDKTNPIGVYGKSKLYGEQEIESSKCKHIIIRTSWVYGEYGNNFLKTMLNLASKNNELNIVSDQFGCPTYSNDIARAAIAIITKIEKNECEWGIFNFCGDKVLSWFDFAGLIFKEAQELNLLNAPKINPILTKDFLTPAARPKYSVLCMKKFIETFEFNPSKVEKGIKDSLKNLSILDAQ